MRTFSFCPMCGEKYSKDRLFRFDQHCDACGYTFYDGQKACVSVVIHNNTQVLLTKRGIEPYKNLWDFPGGFVEPQEKPEEAVHREIKEELGVEVTIDKLWFVNPCVPYVYADRLQHNFDLVYLATIKSGKLNPDDDVSDYQWFDIKNLPNEKDLSFMTVKEVVKKLRNGALEI